MSLVTFIIPVRHQDNARDWSLLKANLVQTIASISNQTNDDWQGIIVANEGADLPDLPERFGVVRVAFPPNDLHEIDKANIEDVYDAFRADKGRRVLMGMLAARNSRFFMIVDDDDLVSARIVQYVAENPDANGWTIDRGYIWDDGGKLLFEYDEFQSSMRNVAHRPVGPLWPAGAIRAGLARLDQADAGQSYPHRRHSGRTAHHWHRCRSVAPSTGLRTKGRTARRQAS